MRTLKVRWWHSSGGCGPSKCFYSFLRFLQQKLKHLCVGTNFKTIQRTLTVEGSNTVRLVSSLTSLDTTASLCTNSNIFSFSVRYSLAKLETSCTVILPQTVSVLWNIFRTYSFISLSIHPSSPLCLILQLLGSRWLFYYLSFCTVITFVVPRWLFS